MNARGRRFFPGSIVISAILVLVPSCINGSVSPRGLAAGGFSLAAEPSAVTISPDGSARIIPDVEFLGTFTSTDTDLWVTDLPPGITARYAPDPLTHEGRSILTLQGDGAVPAGTYPITLGATSGGLSHSLRVSLVVTDKPDFELDASPLTQPVGAGGTAAFRVSVSPLNGFGDPMTWSVQGLPSGTSQAIAQDGRTTATLVVTTSSFTALGQYRLALTGTSLGISHSLPLTLIVGAVGPSWTASNVGSTGSGNNSIRMGAARNDGVNRLYVGTVDTGRVMEFSWDGSAWTGPVDIGGSPTGQEIHNLTVGPGRNDGVNRVYACSLDGNLYELTYAGPGWSQSTVGSPSGSCTHVAVGKGRNDGVNRLYATRGSSVYEYTRTGGWSSVRVGTVSSGIAHGIAIGTGRGGSTRHLYVASTASGTYEACFAGGRWSMTRMGDTGDVRNASVGAGRHDGVRRVYAGTAGGQIREFTWSNGNWTRRAINSSIGSVIVHAYVLAGRNDGIQRVYGSAGDGNAYEFTWNGTGWTRRNMGGGSAYMYGFHFGRRPGSTLWRLYGTGFDGQVYEYSWG